MEKNKKKREEKDEGKKVKRRGENRKREEDNATNSRCLLASSFLFFLSSLFSPFRRDLIQRDHPGIRSVPSLFLSHSPRSGKHELPYSDATSEDQLKQMTSSRARGGSLIVGVSLRMPLQIVPINYDRYSSTSHRQRGIR